MGIFGWGDGEEGGCGAILREGGWMMCLSMGCKTW